MDYNKIGCSAGRATLVDPNVFDGQSSLSNVPVPLEDLSIYVQLVANRNARTILTSSSTNNSADSSGPIIARFIEGTDINGNKVLTTKYTDLTTNFRESTNAENLGITNIDIDFNSMMAPMITINFIDVRGGAIFQNDDAGNSAFGIFFQMPYPMFNLTVKGYYGQPVSYCLHMTRFNSKFNSQTGNFEITANFLGYSYSLISDMLIGMMRAVPYTSVGKAKLKDLAANGITTPTIDEYIKLVSQLNLNVEQLSKDNPERIALSKVESLYGKLNEIKNEIVKLGTNIDLFEDTNEYKFIFTESENQSVGAINAPTTQTTTSNLLSTSTGLISAPSWNTPVTKASVTSVGKSPFNVNPNTTAINEYGNNVSRLIKEYNDIGLTDSFMLSESDFRPLTVYKNITKSGVTESYNNTEVFKDLKNKINKLDIDTINTINDISDAMNDKRYTASESKVVDVYDLRKCYERIEEKRLQISNETERLKQALADYLNNISTNQLGFSPTIRNNINVLTTSADILLRSIFEVSQKAETSTTRVKELEKYKYKNAYDYPVINDTPVKYYPWPEYRKIDDTKGLTEEYLGAKGVLSNPENVDEIKFINELYQGFLQSSKSQEESETNLNNDLTGAKKVWFASNPLDTILFGDNASPYTRIEGKTREAIMIQAIIRSMITLHLSHKSLTSDEIRMIGEMEGDLIYNTVSNKSAIQALSTFKPEDIYNLKMKGGSKEVPILVENNGRYEYNFIYDNTLISNTSILPVNKGILNEGDTGSFVSNNVFYSKNNTIPKVAQQLRTLANDDGFIFLTNYTNEAPVISNEFKTNDGGVYIKIIDSETYEQSTTLPKTPEGYAPVNNGIISLPNFKKENLPDDGSGCGFNIFGGRYGIQEFSTVNYEDGLVDETAFRFIFYADNKYPSNGLALIRNVSGVDSKNNLTTTKYDLNINFEKIEYIDDYRNTIANSTTPTHKDLGKNSALSKAVLTNNDRTITYPYINFCTKDATNSETITFISLFGSEFYYAQETKYAKALLFLHTFSWAGLADGTTGIFNKQEILNSFNIKAGFVNVPKLWAIFIGGLLWRNELTDPIKDENGNIIGGGSGKAPVNGSTSLTDPIIFCIDDNGVKNGSNISKNSTFLIPNSNIDNFNYPSRNNYLKIKSSFTTMMFSSDNEFISLESQLTDLPVQAKEEFKKAFFNFVNNDWDNIASSLEIIDGNNKDLANSWSLVDKLFTTKNKLTKQDLINSGLKNLENYNIVNICTKNSNGQTNYDNNFFLELKDNTDITNTLVNLFVSGSYIANSTWKIWDKSKTNNTDNSRVISLSKETLDTYFKALLTKFENIEKKISEEEKQQAKKVFGDTSSDIIKTQLYRTCKSLYDKWIAGSESEDKIMFKCASFTKEDIAAATKANRDKVSMIDTFRFVDRTFKDIGDEFYIDPRKLVDIIKNGANSSMSDAISRILQMNYFTFTALPNFINFKEEKNLASMFKPYPTNTIGSDVLPSTSSFVCVYVGQTSTNLDFGKNSDRPNDGFDFRCIGTSLSNETPKSFTTGTLSDNENPVTIFSINYGQQNQNIFKDVSLDQSEHSETAESLQTTIDIANLGSETNTTYAGQNLYNVFSVRSYTANVEMMGNVMIQPMMYFQLNNIPMFHGAYIITRVRHNIKPNYMSTNFTGTRVRLPETKIIDAETLYMPWVDSMTFLPGAGTTSNVKFGETSSLNDLGVVTGGFVSNTNNNFASGCKGPSKQLSTLPFYTKENPGPNITSTKITYQDLISYLNSTNLSVPEKRVTYSVAVLEQSKGKNTFNAFGNNLFGFNVEGKYAGVDDAVKKGQIINTFCYRDSESARVFPQFSMWSDSVKLFANNIVTPRFIDASRKDGYWNKVTPSLNFYNNGIKNTDTSELQALKFTVLYFMEWNSPSYKADVVNSIGSQSNPIYGVYTDPATNNKRNTKHVHDIYMVATSIFK